MVQRSPYVSVVGNLENLQKHSRHSLCRVFVDGGLVPVPRVIQGRCGLSCHKLSASWAPGSQCVALMDVSEDQGLTCNLLNTTTDALFHCQRLA